VEKTWERGPQRKIRENPVSYQEGFSILSGKDYSGGNGGRLPGRRRGRRIAHVTWGEGQEGKEPEW